MADKLLQLDSGRLKETSFDLNIANWDTAYGWGDHSTEGYLDSTAADALYHRLDSANTPFTGAVEIDVTDASYALDVNNAETRTGAGIRVSLADKSHGYYLDCYDGTSSVFTVSNTRVDASVSFYGTLGSFSSAVYATVFRPSDGTATSPAYQFNNDTNTGLYRAGIDRLGFTTAGTKCAEFTAAGDLQLVKKLAINYTGTIDSGVQIHMKGDASNNANIKLDGYTAGFFYFGFNDTYSKAALSVSDGTTTTWDALNIDENGLVQIGDSLSDTATGRINVTENHATRPTMYIKQSGAGDIAQFIDGSTEVMSIEDDGRVTHTASVVGSRSVVWLRPPYFGTLGSDGADYWSQSATGTQYLAFDIPRVINYGGIMKIRKIVARMTTAASNDYIDATNIYRTNADGSRYTVYANTSNYGQGVTGGNDYTIYDSTGITLTDAPHDFVLALNHVTSNGVKIRGIALYSDYV